jgi:hypothetical protein
LAGPQRQVPDNLGSGFHFAGRLDRYIARLGDDDVFPGGIEHGQSCDLQNTVGPGLDVPVARVGDLAARHLYREHRIAVGNDVGERVRGFGRAWPHVDGRGDRA